MSVDCITAIACQMHAAQSTYSRGKSNVNCRLALASSPGHTPPTKEHSFVGGVWPGDEARLALDHSVSEYFQLKGSRINVS